MNLRDFLHMERIRGVDFARLVNHQPEYICQIRNGKIKPGKKLAKLIELATDGKVTVAELRGPEKK